MEEEHKILIWMTCIVVELFFCVLLVHKYFWLPVICFILTFLAIVFECFVEGGKIV